MNCVPLHVPSNYLFVTLDLTSSRYLKPQPNFVIPITNNKKETRKRGKTLKEDCGL